MIGTDVVISDALPTSPSDGDNARRIVRHGLADVLGWLGEDVGPRPGQKTHAYMVGGKMLVSRYYYRVLREQAAERPLYPIWAGLWGIF